MVKLFKEEIVTIEVLHQKGESNQAVANRLNVNEGTVRYHLKRKAQNAVDGRSKA